jgi:putative membrane protein
MDRSSKSWTLARALVAAGVLAACAAGGASEEETGSVGDAGPDLSDANVFALLDHANHADSAAGSVAAVKGTDQLVRGYARRMMSDHHRLRRQSTALARKLDVVPQPPADDPVTALAHQGMATLESAAKGRRFDRAYIEHEVRAHQAALELAEQSLHSAGNAELRTMIQQTLPLIRAHLGQAQEILEELGDTA